MNNKEFIAKAIQEIQNPYKEGKLKRGTLTPLFYGNGTIYSYGFHFPLVVFSRSHFYVNSDKYSVTTSKQQGMLQFAISQAGFEYAHKTTEEMKELAKLPVHVEVTKDETCNGWTNWETWSANLWLTNDINVWNEAKKCATASKLRALYIDLCSDNWREGGDFGDHKDYDKVNWEEIFESLQQD